MFYTDPDSMTTRNLICYIFPGSVYLTFKVDDDYSNCAIWVIWELLILVGAVFIPFLLFYLSCKKALALFGCATFDGGHTLAFNIVELFFLKPFLNSVYKLIYSYTTRR